MLKPCQHCQMNLACRPRGLCYQCYLSRAIRRLHHPRTRNRLDTNCRTRRLPARPTTAQPGSEAKLLVFQQRLARRESLFHPRDK